MWHLQNFHPQLFFFEMRNSEFRIQKSEFGIENLYRSKKKKEPFGPSYLRYCPVLDHVVAGFLSHVLLFFFLELLQIEIVDKCYLFREC